MKHSTDIIQVIPSAERLANKCQALGIYIQHEKQFCFDKNNDRDGFIRLGFAGMNENKFAEGIELLVNSLNIKH
ncbi:hypothetical protein C427_2142 [Paraglaciecola psychrophila 170]|uniref:GntR family transcriptional regulator n=1 Tax=Paraglaciecola psychrophila 170 TaxID=1129794 RepID=M4RL10_9ALTE|nr:hypothetical protein [Paraglaciecola psychrophila]AGH44251.1 hypothetical protein C427_2142 [Paraglaciecola psychrophila 170]